MSATDTLNAPRGPGSAMKIVELSSAPSAVSLYTAAVGASSKRLAAVDRLPELTYVRPDVRVDAGHVARYAQVCGFTRDQGVPLTYPHMLAFPLHMKLICSSSFPWPVMGTVHLTNSVRQHRRIQAGDRLRVEATFGALTAHDKGQLFSLLTRVLRDGELVWESESVNLRMGVKAPRGPAFESALLYAAPLSRQLDFSAPAGIGRRYGRVSGDINPIHLSALSAKLFGFPRAIAHGMWTKARALAAVLPRQALDAGFAQVEFKTPLFLPGRASLWTAPLPDGVLFEVRNGRGDKPHLRGRVAL